MTRGDMVLMLLVFVLVVLLGWVALWTMRAPECVRMVHGICASDGGPMAPCASCAEWR